MSTLGKIWANRKKILEGVVNSVIKDEFVEQVAEHRMEICKTCDYYDGDCTVKGSGPCCGACGCSLGFKTRSLTSVCGAVEKQEDPKWLPVLSREQEAKMESDLHENQTNTGTTSEKA